MIPVGPAATYPTPSFPYFSENASVKNKFAESIRPGLWRVYAREQEIEKRTLFLVIPAKSLRAQSRDPDVEVTALRLRLGQLREIASHAISFSSAGSRIFAKANSGMTGTRVTETEDTCRYFQSMQNAKVKTAMGRSPDRSEPAGQTAKGRAQVPPLQRRTAPSIKNTDSINSRFAWPPT